MFGTRPQVRQGPAWREDPTHYYALMVAFDNVVSRITTPIGDECELPAPKTDIEVALFLSFNGINNAGQYHHLKKLIGMLGSFIKLSERDRLSIHSRHTLMLTREKASAEVATELTRVLGWSIPHYEALLSKALRSTTEMIDKLNAFDQQFNLAERFDAHR